MKGLAIAEIGPLDLKLRLAAGEPPVILDVREAWELTIACLESVEHIPMADVPDRLDDLDRSREIIVLCHHGRRSRQVVAFLKQSGFPRVLNLTGGIDAWSQDVDPGVPIY